MSQNTKPPEMFPRYPSPIFGTIYILYLPGNCLSDQEPSILATSYSTGHFKRNVILCSELVLYQAE